MKIAYVAEWDFSESSGVGKKMVAQSTAWCELGHEVRLFIVSPEATISSDFTNVCAGIDSYTSQFLSMLPRGSFRTYLNKMLCSKRMYRELKGFSPDIIYYRQGIYYPGLSKVLSVSPFIMELNTDDLSEMELESSLKRALYKLGRGRLLRESRGLVAVSNEIASLYEQYGKPIEVIANGVSSDWSKECISRKLKKNAQLVFVGSPDQPWHGVDKIADLAGNLVDVDFHIVGGHSAPADPLDNVTYHNNMNSRQLVELYSWMDIGIGTLALHRKNMEEASPLKVRDYLLNGLPVIIGYDDTDLKGQKFLLNIGNYEENIINSLREIESFIKRWRGARITRQEVEPIIGTRFKEESRLAHFSRVLMSEK